jgi:histidine triad (HIT) family protein
VCTFCQIVAGELPAHVVVDHDDALGFLDLRPVFKGHVLVVPRDHIETLIDLPAERLGGFFAQVQRVAGAVETGLGAGGTFVAMNNRISQSVLHLHCHVVPRNPKDGLRGFFWPRTKYDSDDEAATYARRIAAAV